MATQFLRSPSPAIGIPDAVSSDAADNDIRDQLLIFVPV